MTDTVKLIIEIDKRAYKACQELRTNNDDGIIGLCAVNAIADGIPLDDVKAEIFRQSEQNNENFSHDWNKKFNDGMFHTLTIIGDYFMHIGKAEREGE